MESKSDLLLILSVLEDNLHDLSMWSVYNGDEYSEAIEVIRSALSLIKKDVTEDYDKTF